MHWTEDTEIIKDFHKRSGHGAATVVAYQTVFNKYTKFHKTSLCDLLDEAIAEQENHVPKIG